MNKSIIGIVDKHHINDIEVTRPYSKNRDEVKQAIFDNGGILIGIIFPIKAINIIKNIEDYEDILKEYIITQIDLCDGITLKK